jgi:hypothetical protein
VLLCATGSTLLSGRPSIACASERNCAATKMARRQVATSVGLTQAAPSVATPFFLVAACRVFCRRPDRRRSVHLPVPLPSIRAFPGGNEACSPCWSSFALRQDADILPREARHEQPPGVLVVTPSVAPPTSADGCRRASITPAVPCASTEQPRRERAACRLSSKQTRLRRGL